jgi:uncharacterized protein (DUF433 family)
MVSGAIAMSTATTYPHIVIDKQGVARLGDTRYKVLHLTGEHYHYGWSAEELLRQHPDLKPEEVYAALTYFYDYFEPMVSELAQNGQRTRAAGAAFASPLSREELLKRAALAEQP